MKYNIFGFDQKLATILELNLQDLAILQWFTDYRDYPDTSMIAKEFDKEVYHNVHYKALLEEYPILGLKSVKSITRCFDRLVAAKVLKKKLYKKGGTYTYFRYDFNYFKLSTKYNKKTEKSSTSGHKSPVPADTKVQTKDHSTNNHSTKDNINTGEQSPPADPIENTPLEKEVPKIPDNPDETYLRKTGWWLYFQFKEREEKRIGKQFEYTASEKTAEYGQCKNIVRWICREGITFEQFFKAFDKQRKDKNSLSFNDPYIPRRVSKYKFDDIRKHITPEKDPNDWSGYHESFC